MSNAIHFQSPNTGTAMYLTRSRKDGKLMVLIEDQADYTEADEIDAHEMSLRIRERGIDDTASAIKILRREFEVSL